MYVALLLLLITHVPAQSSYAPLMAQLDDERFEEREQASAKLLALPRLDLWRLAATPTTPEQHNRIGEAIAVTSSNLIPRPFYEVWLTILNGDEDHDLRLGQALGFIDRHVGE